MNNETGRKIRETKETYKDTSSPPPNEISHRQLIREAQTHVRGLNSDKPLSASTSVDQPTQANKKAASEQQSTLRTRAQAYTDQWRQQQHPIEVRMLQVQRSPVTYHLYKIGDQTLVAMSPRQQDAPITEASETLALRNQGFYLGDEVKRGTIVRCEPPTYSCNCHGYTFLNGKGWLDNLNNAIDTILRNGPFQRTFTPQSGDIVIYRSSTSRQIRHSGQIYDIQGNNIHLISKWDAGSSFYHHQDDVPDNYKGTVEYYRPTNGWRYFQPTFSRML
jgi:hypothetical protein